MQMGQINTRAAMIGHIKWFDPKRDYGFIVPSDGGPDILLHGNILRDFGQSSVRTGAQVEMYIRKGQHGLQVDELLNVVVSDEPETSPLSEFDHLPTDEAAYIEPVPARIKWFNANKGYGFAQAFGESDDIFIHSRVLHQAGLDVLNAGEAVSLRCGNSARGKVAVQLLPWS